MDKHSDGSFSLGLKSLQIHVQALLEGCGGERAEKLLDLLSQFGAGQQQVILAQFIEVLKRLSTSKDAPSLQEDTLLTDFEERLYKDILESMRQAANSDCVPTDIGSHDQGSKRFALVSGGKNGVKTAQPSKSGLIDLNEARQARRSKHRSAFN